MATIEYRGNRNLKSAGVAVEYTPEMAMEFAKCAEDPVYFIKNYVKIVHVDKGLVKFALWDFQEELIHKILDNRFVIARMGRQIGKTTTVAAVLLHYVLFNENFSIAILANKERQAREILGRIQMMFEYLPKWLQQGVVEWNKGNIELENGSKILASSTSSSAIRGTSQNVLYLDEFAFVPNNLQEEFFTSVYPTISSGKTTKVIITSTPNGMNMFYKIWKDAEDGKNSYATHYVQWNDVPGRDDEWRAETIRNTSERQFQQEYCCDFLGSSNTLIDARKIGQLTYSSPLHEANGVEIFHHPEPNRSYLMTVDTSRGAGIDYSAFIVFDITEIPYKMVAKFRSDEIPVLVYPNVIHQVGTYYNDSLVLVEINDIGQQVADILHFDLEYEGVIFTQTKGKAGQKIGQGFGKTKPQLGVRTTTSVKRIGCSNFKNLVESDKLILCDVDLIFELSRFIAVKNSYEAEEGYHDDLVMCCVLFAWMVNQPYFKELTDTDVRYRLSQDQSELIDAHLSPFIIDDGNDFEEESNDFYSLNW